MSSSYGNDAHIFRGSSGAEQDRYGGHFGGKVPSASDIASKLPGGSGAEQDRYEGWFGGKSIPLDKLNRKLPRASGAEQDRLGSHFGSHPDNPVNTTFVGLFQKAVLPSFGLHAGLAAVAYGVGRYTDRAEAKDWLWPAGMTANAWWSAIGARVVYDGLSISQAWSRLGYTEKLLLSGVSAWGLRLFYRVASRSARRGRDDPRYEAAKKKDPKFWDTALFSMFIPEAVAQTLISLPFTFIFRAGTETGLAHVLLGDYPVLHDVAVFLFSAGMSLEVLADAQLESHKQNAAAAESTLNRQGVWSIVRHPNYLGDALIHLSFPLLLLGSGLLHPVVLLGPALNYAFLRLIGGDVENEASQAERYSKESPEKHRQLKEYQHDKNSFWPALEEIKNKWTWTCVAAGVGGVLLERGVRTWLYT